MPPKAALGYIQCKQRYASQEEVLGVAREYRRRVYPCDMLIVDWFHWKTLGDLDLDEKLWPDPSAMNRELAAMGYQVMISAWPRFMKESRHWDTLESRGWFMKQAGGETLYGTPEDQRGAVIDTTNPATGRWYWDTIRDSYAAKGFTSWWMDEDEPDVCPHPYFLHAGTGSAVHNLYPLTHTLAVSNGHRRDLPHRCLILSRSAYLGAQRTGSTFWSSDIYPEWDVLRRQIPAGLNFCATGFPYWSSDIGGWQALADRHDKSKPAHAPLIEPDEQARQLIGDYDDYVELYVRWFQFGAFCPTFRAHGTRSANEVWSYGAAAEKILVEYLRLRYRLMPYIYSLAYGAWRTGAPFMRAMWMDFPDDPLAADLRDQYMFGPAFLVAPVTQQGQPRRSVYLPAGANWYDYWTNRRYAGGQPIEVDAPIRTLPLFVRAGSIIPHGPVVEHTGQEQRDIEIRIYEGADGRFDWYDDDGKTYEYEKGQGELLTIRWDDRTKQATLEGDTPMLRGRLAKDWLRRIG
jgi:alpha-D-xyloside xylohydrolase